MILILLLLSLTLLQVAYLLVWATDSFFSLDLVLFHSLDPSIEKQPCVSDEEFCALMPEISEEVALKVRELLCAASGWDRDEIHPNTRIVEFDHY